MTSSFDRVRVLWPDHLGLARGKYVPASLADDGCAPLHGHLGTRLRPRHDARDAGLATGTRACPTSTRSTTWSDIRPGWEAEHRGSSWPTSMRDGEPFAVVAAHRAAPGDRRLARHGLRAPTSASSSRPTSSSPTATAAGGPSTRPAPSSTARDPRSTHTV